MSRFLFAFLFLSTLPCFADETTKIGDSLEFTLPMPDGQEFTLSSQYGKVILVDFWATYCKPCQKELPFLDKLSSKYKKKGLLVFGVNVDPNTSKAKEYLKKNPLRFLSLFDPKDTLREKLDVWDLPLLYVIDRHGKIRAIHKGILEEDNQSFLKEIEALLSETK